MNFVADLHVHSKFSRATAKNMDLENLYIAAQLKGITVIGTGDFTHPGWFSEIKEKLIPAEQGLFKLRDDISIQCDEKVPISCRNKVRFILVSEISNIYKKKGKTRKNHNLVFIPDLDTAKNFNLRLDKIGNINSDGRPILGLDAKDLLEILLETCEQNFLVPAHIWTPWFSLFGSKSGFDSIKECFEDLSSNIFAVETGLSSDPAMNWRFSDLDDITLISNSDAHSPLNMGREANIFEKTELSYSSIKGAIKNGDPKQFKGTFEFYPEEGKYHLDGHRKCNIIFKPQQTREKKGICPLCGKPLTCGVLYRVEELADRLEGEKPRKTHPFYNLIPLSELLSEILKVNPKSKKVQQNYIKSLEKLGSEFEILHTLPTEIIKKRGIPLLDEAVKRMRQKRVFLYPGYDGVYGKVKVFQSGEIEKLLGQKDLFSVPVSYKDAFKKDRFSKKEKKTNKTTREKKTPFHRVEESFDDIQTPFKKGPECSYDASKKNIIEGLNQEQRQAVQHEQGPMLIVAGPGTGKTRTLTHKIAYLVKKKDISPTNILAVTFTNKAAREMIDRLRKIMNETVGFPYVSTFHSLCFNILKDQTRNSRKSIVDEKDRILLIKEAIKQVEKKEGRIHRSPQFFLKKIMFIKQRLLGPDDHLKEIGAEKKNDPFLSVYQSYEKILSIQELYDYEDIILKVVNLFNRNPAVRRHYENLFKFIFVDEYQDVNHGQMCLLRLLAPPQNNLCVIGDPDQSIYGFRGSDAKYFKQFIGDYPDANVISLTRNYRSTETILEASNRIIKDHRMNTVDSHLYSGIDGKKRVGLFELGSEKSEAVAVGKSIEEMIGGTGFHSVDFGKADLNNRTKSLSFSDFTVLYRTGDQGRVFSDVFEKAGIPYQIVSRENVLSRKGIWELLSLLKVVEATGSFIDLERSVKISTQRVGKKTFDMFKTWCFKNRFNVEKALLNTRRYPIPGMSNARQRRLLQFLERLSVFRAETQKMTVEEKLFYLAEQTKASEILKKDSKTKEAFDKLIDFSKKSDQNFLGFYNNLALQSDTDIYEQKAEKVSLMTMHAAKGLEFPVVFIAGCEKGYIPFERKEEEINDIEEERRLFYVAMTRAKDRLFFTFAKKRRIYGKLVAREISPFVKEIEERLKAHEGVAAGKKKKQVQLELF